jgi:hypothetical protein
MKLNTILDIYQLISSGTQELPFRKQSMELRSSGLQTFSSNSGFTKVAFDTRRIDQETDIIPRRNLQNYHRSEAFVSEAMHDKIVNLAKLRKALISLQEKYGRDHESQDSNARVLLSTLDKGLRTIQKDGDYSESQQGVGSLRYIEELLHVRYRLGFDDLVRMGETDLQEAILSKDEELLHKDINRFGDTGNITKNDVASKTYDTLINKLFDGCRASADSPDVERTISITIRDRFHKEG